MIKRTTLCDSIVDEIKSYIKKNKLSPGDKLPNQQELCDIMGVSKTPLREALRILQALNVITVENGKGIYVKKSSQFKIQTTINVDEKKSIIEMLELRKAIENFAVKLAVERATEREVAQIENIFDKMSEKSLKGESEPDEDKEFHRLVYRTSKNKVLIDMLDNIYDILDVLWKNPLGIGSAMNELKLHRDILESIKQKRPEKAEKAVSKLIDSEIMLIKHYN